MSHSALMAPSSELEGGDYFITSVPLPAPPQALHRLAHIMGAHCVPVESTRRTIHHQASCLDSKIRASSEEGHWASCRGGAAGFLEGLGWCIRREGGHSRHGANLSEVRQEEGSWHAWGTMKKQCLVDLMTECALGKVMRWDRLNEFMDYGMIWMPGRWMCIELPAAVIFLCDMEFLISTYCTLLVSF